MFYLVKKLNLLKASFKLSEKEIVTLLKQASTLKSLHILFEGKNVMATNLKNSSANTFTLEVETESPIGRCYISNDAFQKIIVSDYTVKVNSEVVVFENLEKKLVFVVGCLR